MNDPYKTSNSPLASADGPTAIDSAPTPPKHIGRYRIERLLGRGGFGFVYLAHDEQLQRLVAIKVPYDRLVTQTTDAEAYLTEAGTVASLDHPHIVPVYDVGRTEQFPCFVVSKYIDGMDLANRLKQSRLSLLEAAELVATVAEALHHAHKHGLVHRDIKPGNILLDRSGKPYVGDFGLALREQDVGKGPRYAGTPAYMSPEQARGEGHRVDGRSDVFSLGVVFYELLAGRHPFRADSQADLMEQVANHEPRPLRQMDESIPRELERICFKALSKRASERYMTAKDIAEDLRHFLAEQTVNQQSNHHVVASRSTTEVRPYSNSTSSRRTVPLGGSGEVPPITPTEPGPVIKIVPKGLRSFDAHDADFFLELLPGPRDRDGLPDSLRFWKTLIEETEAEKTFSVGLICGPSGCGKSSLVKAGLLPRLPGNVIAVYLEATAQETEVRLLNGLRKRCPSLPLNVSLKEALASLRRGQGIPSGKKVLIVLDQFEQWLHAKKEEENTELLQALRQCDGARLQCIVMVRDDFWMAVIRFMRDLEVRLVEGENSAAVDLFDMDHARKVLAAFGRAFGRLPENVSDLNKDQKEFLKQAVAGLAQEGKVISVRLALFAEMMKGKPWTLASLRAVGGTEGVGITFLEETFSAATAPPEHRYHQKAARSGLKVLLPDTGTDIKRHMRAYAELLEASGYGGRPKDFDDLIHILDKEIRLITPTDPEGKDTFSDSNVQTMPGQKYYQLTHDYLVHSIREWLTRKQKETRRGRAELWLADRAAVWNLRQENRQLPTLAQWALIRWLTVKKNWTPMEQKFMKKAARFHAVWVMVMATLLTGVAFTGLIIREQNVEQRKATEAAGLVHRLLDAETAQVPAVVDEMKDFRRWTDPLLREEENKAAATSRQKLHARLALLPVDPGQVDYLYSRLLDAQPHEVPVIRDALAGHKDGLLDKLWAVVETPQKGKESQRLRAASALAKYDPDNRKWLTAQKAVANDLVGVPPVHLSLWIDALRPVRKTLIPQLSAVFADAGRRETERSLAADILADYAADQPQVLAELVMNASPRQFAVIYPKFSEQSEKALPVLAGELQLIARDKLVFEKADAIDDSDAKIKSPLGEMPAKRYEVRMQPGKKYLVMMDSKVLDPVLVLQNKSGKVLAFDDDSGGDLNASLLFSPEAEEAYSVFAASLKGTGTFQLRITESFGGDGDGKEKLAKRQANAAVALLKMGQADKVWPLLKRSKQPDDPRLRSYLTHLLRPLGADPGTIAQHLDLEPDITIRRALILSLGEYAEAEFEDRKKVTKKLQAIYESDPDPGLHAAAEWLLRTWQRQSWLKQANEGWAANKKQREERLAGIMQLFSKEKEQTPPQWYVNGQGQTMVVIPGPLEFKMGSPVTEAGRHNKNELLHKKQIGRTFALAAKPVTLEQYRRFDPTYELPPVYTRLPNMPVVGVEWYVAVKYCNWLSKQEGIPEDQWCYEFKRKEIRISPFLGATTLGLLGSPLGNGAYLAASRHFPSSIPAETAFRLKPGYLSLTGYRLPTEAEMEYATRAGALTSRYYGETEELLPMYAWYNKNSQEKPWPVGSLKPNDLGFFDLHGNVFAWCQQRYFEDFRFPQDSEYDLLIGPTIHRTMRGGSFMYPAENARSAFRINIVPTNRTYTLGIRPAKTVLPLP